MKMPFGDKLLTVYFDYLEEVVAIKALLKLNKLESLVNLAVIAEKDLYPNVAKAVSNRLHRALNAIDVEIKMSYCAFEYERWLEAKYLLAATVDEIFIHTMKWEGSRYWLDNLLEQKINDSRNAGVTVFKRIDLLVMDKSGEGAYIVLAKLYYYSIQVGFEGMLRSVVDREDSLKSVKQSLQRFIGERPLLKSDLFGQGKKNNGTYGKGTRIASMQPWLRMAAISAIAYLFVSSYVWLTSIDSFHRVISMGQ